MGVAELSALIKRYGGNLPRYTSYPTAASFTASVGFSHAQTWLSALPIGSPISLYCHVPFCDELCRFCGCNTSVVRQEAQRRAYAETLKEELHRVARLVGQRRVQHIHFGGGTPTTLPLDALRDIMQTIATLFTLDPNGEIAMELDPRHVPVEYPPVLGALGFNRISLGVQDINPQVQQACGRLQSFEQTKNAVEQIRAAGIGGVNIDLIYGLPYQTQESVTQTALQIVTLKPERLAVFGYAHVPWKQKRQQLMPEQALPDSAERLAQRACLERVFEDAGYEKIGLDHYALPTDSMACAARAGTLHRNFQGYTVDTCQALIGVGASAVSMLPQGFTQNHVAAAQYSRALAESEHLPTARGVARREEDRLRWAIIERLMCDLCVDLQNPFESCFCAQQDSQQGAKALSSWTPEEGTNGALKWEKERAALEPFIQDELITLCGSTINVTEKGRPFLRHIASVFDTYREELAQQAQKQIKERAKEQAQKEMGKENTLKNTSLKQGAPCFSTSL